MDYWGGRPSVFDRRALLQFLATAVLLVLGAILPLIVGFVLSSVLVLIYVYIILATSWDIIYGYAGQVNLGVAFPYGASGLLTAIMVIRGINPAIALAISSLLSTGLSVLFNFPALRLKGAYFAISSFSSTLVFQLLATNYLGEEGWSAANGIIPLFSSPVYDYYFAYAITVLAVIFLLLIANSKLGQRFKALRDDELAFESLGLNASKYKMGAFAISSIFPSIIGGFVTLVLVHYDPSWFSYNWTFASMAMAVFGGVGSIVGPLIGAAVLGYITLFLSGTVWKQVLYGVTLVIVIRWVPGGIWSMKSLLFNLLRRVK
jgi:branched-chain amino acid transport system permease protein